MVSYSKKTFPSLNDCCSSSCNVCWISPAASPDLFVVQFPKLAWLAMYFSKPERLIEY